MPSRLWNVFPLWNSGAAMPILAVICNKDHCVQPYHGSWACMSYAFQLFLVRKRCFHSWKLYWLIFYSRRSPLIRQGKLLLPVQTYIPCSNFISIFWMVISCKGAIPFAYFVSAPAGHRSGPWIRNGLAKDGLHVDQICPRGNTEAQNAFLWLCTR